jgi:hypothetical protein
MHLFSYSQEVLGVDLALEKGLQIVTRQGKDVVVVVAKSEFDRRRAGQAARARSWPS